MHDPSSNRIRAVMAPCAAAAVFFLSGAARAQGEAAVPVAAGPDPAANVWVMVSTALVLFMTLPGLALFYGGLVRKKNVLSVLAQCLGIACVVTPLWWLCGYSLSFGTGSTSAFIGDFTSNGLFAGVESGKTGAGSPGISDSMWAMFQLTFAIITPALMVGAVAERIKFSAVMAFVVGWMFVVYFPFAHMVWGTNGFMCGPLNAAQAGIKALDFAGGTVVHMTSGWSALVLCIILGKRRGLGREPLAPHSMVLCMVGTGMLWVGWFGFNAGSALAPDAIAANAFTTTMLAAATAGLGWAVTEWALRGKPSVLGICSGIVGGLVVITPACGYVSPSSAVLMGALGGVVPYFAVSYLKRIFRYDDALDTFGIHGVGGTLGAIRTGVFADAKINPIVGTVREAAGHSLVWEQLKAVGLTIGWSLAATAAVAYLIKAVLGLRASAEVEVTGLDLAEHGEQGYEH